MEQNELNYKKTLSSIGWMLVIFWGCMQIYAVMVSVLQIVLEFLPLSDMWSYVIYQLFYGAGYLAVFMLPVLFFKPFLSHSGCTAVPMELGPRVSPALPFLIFARASCFATSLSSQADAITISSQHTASRLLAPSSISAFIIFHWNLQSQSVSTARTSSFDGK